MKLYLSLARIWTGTQADAKAAQGGPGFETIEVPTSKPELIQWLNERWAAFSAPGQPVMIRGQDGAVQPLTIPETTPEPRPAPELDPSKMRAAQLERFESVARKLGWTPPGEQPTASKRDLGAEILELDAAALPAILSAAIGRLGEIAGTNGWGAFAKHVYSWTPGSRSVEQGLGMLMLAAMEQMTAKTSESDQSTD
jgi:hypothetical protein